MDDGFNPNVTTDQVAEIVRLMEAIADRWRAVYRERVVYDCLPPETDWRSLSRDDSPLTEMARVVAITSNRCDKAVVQVLDAGVSASFVASITSLSVDRIEELNRRRAELESTGFL